MINNELTHQIIGAAIEVHRHMGPGLLETVYEVCLAHELSQSGLQVMRQIPLPVVYKDIHISQGYRLDLLVENQVIVELKSVDRLIDVHEAQILSYLKLSGHRVGLLMNFNVKMMKDGIKRYVM